jgi:hypothetical protein
MAWDWRKVPIVTITSIVSMNSLVAISRGTAGSCLVSFWFLVSGWHF